jgi:hypothetical protein
LYQEIVCLDAVPFSQDRAIGDAVSGAQSKPRRGGYTYFNYYHAHARAKIEPAIMIPKEQWKSLRIRSAHDHSKTLCSIMVSFILHNFVQIREEDVVRWWRDGGEMVARVLVVEIVVGIVVDIVANMMVE